LGEDSLPIEPVEAYLAHLEAGGSSPNTVAGYAYDLKDFFTWMGQEHFEFREVDLERLALFFAWLRRPRALREPGVFMLPGTPTAMSNSTLARKRAALAGFYRFHARRDAEIPALLGELVGPQPTGRYQPMLAHLRRSDRSAAESGSPIRIPVHRTPPAVLSDEEVATVLAACARRRDRFLFGLLDTTGLRISEALGLRHSDLRLRRGEIHVVHRDDNANQARVKGGKSRIVPADGRLLEDYGCYMEEEYGSLDSDYVFVTLFRGAVGSPLTRSAVSDLVRRIRLKTGIGHFHPHALRHTYATRLLRRRVPVEVVAELLGHSSSQTTADIYSHLSVEDHRRILVEAGVLEAAS
jgi:site-specific recombinase XerD